MEIAYVCLKNFVFFFITFFLLTFFFCSVILYVHTYISILAFSYSFLTHHSGSTIFRLYDLCFLMTTLQKREIASLLAFILCWCMKNDGNLWFLSGSIRSLSLVLVYVYECTYFYYIIFPFLMMGMLGLFLAFSKKMWDNCRFVFEWNYI